MTSFFITPLETWGSYSDRSKFITNYVQIVKIKFHNKLNWLWTRKGEIFGRQNLKGMEHWKKGRHSHKVEIRETKRDLKAWDGAYQSRGKTIKQWQKLENESNFNAINHLKRLQGQISNFNLFKSYVWSWNHWMCTPWTRMLLNCLTLETCCITNELNNTPS